MSAHVNESMRRKTASLFIHLFVIGLLLFVKVSHVRDALAPMYCGSLLDKQKEGQGARRENSGGFAKTAKLHCVPINGSYDPEMWERC